jgi:hypothetical protein
MKSQISISMIRRAEPWIALALCSAALLGWIVEHFISNRPAYAATFSPDWIPLAASVLAATGIMLLNGRSRFLRLRRALIWSGLLLMVWAANGLPFDLLRIARLIPLAVDWPGLATRALALAAAVVLARLALAGPQDSSSIREVRSTHVVNWYGYAAFALALPYPVLRTWWALGGTPGLMWPGAAGDGFAPWLLSIPWLLAAALSLLLVSTPRWIPRRLLLTAGWSATAIVAMIGPAAFWSLVTTLVSGSDSGMVGIAIWVPGIFYSSWFLWAIAGGVATRSYQLQSAVL